MRDIKTAHPVHSGEPFFIGSIIDVHILNKFSVLSPCLIIDTFYLISNFSRESNLL